MDLNIDIGEGGGCDDVLLAVASSANIACGGHAGGGDVMRVAIARSREAGVAIGAHPGYRDRENFGRVETGDAVAELAGEIGHQLMEFCDVFGSAPHHVKLHGALYHRADRDREVAEMLCGLIMDIAPLAWVYAFVGGGLLKMAETAGLRVCGEGFIDRGYGADGMLIPRGEPGAIVESVDEATMQAVRLASGGCVRTLCVHGDGCHAVAVLTSASKALKHHGWRIKAPD